MASRINIPPLTRGLLLALFIITLLNAALRYRFWNQDGMHELNSRTYYVPFFTIIPGSSLFYPWVFVTATFSEQNVVGFAITGVTLFYGGRYLERAWSSREYSKFIAITCLIPNLLTFFSYISLYALTYNDDLVTTGISGGTAIQAAFIVAFKQLVPEHTVTVLRGLIRTRVKHFPAIFLLANTISGVLFGTDTAMLLAWTGFLTTWIYLRFYRVSPLLISSATGGSDSSSGATIKGDASDTFAFACFFPDAVQPPISQAADAVYNILVSLRVCTPFSAADVDISNEQASARGDGELPTLLHPGRGSGRREEAERRRALALRALDQRLQSSSTRGGGAGTPKVPATTATTQPPAAAAAAAAAATPEPAAPETSSAQEETTKTEAPTDPPPQSGTDAQS